ncbi:MAG: ATP synthase gamma chain [Phycisphaeraceae bacterium]|nr:MAG: ATP synthase gamma chain [Phycisphaeraceae bacterium]
MGKTREIKNRMKAVGNIKRITRTMQMIATSKFAKAQSAAQAPKPYTGALFDLVAQLAGGDASHPLLAEADASAPELTLLITSDRGLCGPYNGSLIRAALKHLRANATAMSGPVEVVGKKGMGVLKFSGVPIAQHHTQFGDKPQFDDVRRLADNFVERFLAGEISAVRVVYMQYISAGRQSPQVMQLLPLRAPEATEADAGPRAVYEFSPSADELLDALIPAAVRSLLFQCFNDAIVSEHVARMVAMKSATDNAGKMGNSLRRQFNRARQSQITTELTEIISGAAALE